jgi:hypothetical protein
MGLCRLKARSNRFGAARALLSIVRRSCLSCDYCRCRRMLLDFTAAASDMSRPMRCAAVQCSIRTTTCVILHHACAVGSHCAAAAVGRASQNVDQTRARARPGEHCCYTEMLYQITSKASCSCSAELWLPASIRPPSRTTPPNCGYRIVRARHRDTDRPSTLL